jgi:hypothetical protein
MGGGGALEIETFLGPVKWHRTVIGECYLGPKKVKRAVNFDHKTY